MPVTLQFTLEAQLCDALRSTLGTRLAHGTRHLHLSAEVQVGAVVPDLLALRAPLTPSFAATLSNMDSWVLCELLAGGPKHPATIARRLYATDASVRARLAMLQRLGVVSSTMRGAYTATCRSYFEAAELIAVEAKLRRWREAAAQALRYLEFANESYMALPEETISTHRATIIQTCKQSGIGLISVTPEDVCFIVQAPRRKLRNPNWLWAISKMQRRASAQLEARNSSNALRHAL